MYEELISQMESLEIEGDNKGADSTDCTGCDRPPTKMCKDCKKESAMQILLGTLSE